MSDESRGSSDFPSKVTFHFLKSNLHRTVHVDGAFGGVTPQGLINVQLYSERFPIPDATTHTLSPDGRLGEELTRERVGRDGIVRELEVGLVMNTSAARALRDWLTTHIAVVEEALEKSEER